MAECVYQVLRKPAETDLRIETVIVTGGSQGMGKAVAILLAKKGANVLIVARTVQNLEVALKDISVSHCSHRPPRMGY